MKQFLNLSLASTVILFSACGGSIDNPEVVFEPDVGRLVDAPIANITYRTLTQIGVTNNNGEFNYFGGETITFSIGGIDIASVNAEPLLTPVEIFGDLIERNANELNRSAVNFGILMQSLDTDGDPDNGIEISDETHTAILTSGVEQFNFDQLTADFVNEITPLIANSNTATGQVVDVDSALSHMAISIAATPADSDLDGVYDYEDVFVDNPSNPGIDSCIVNNDGRIEIIAGQATLSLNEQWPLLGLTYNHFIAEEGNLLPLGPAEGDDLLDLPTPDDFDQTAGYAFNVNSPSFQYPVTNPQVRLAASTSFSYSDNGDITDSATGDISLSGVMRFEVNPAFGGGFIVVGDLTLAYNSDAQSWELKNNIQFPSTTFSIGNAALSTDSGTGFELAGDLLGTAELALILPGVTGVDLGDFSFTASCIESSQN